MIFSFWVNDISPSPQYYKLLLFIHKVMKHSPTISVPPVSTFSHHFYLISVMNGTAQDLLVYEGYSLFQWIRKIPECKPSLMSPLVSFIPIFLLRIICIRGIWSGLDHLPK